MTADTDWIIRWATLASEGDVDRGMAVPPAWDPYFALGWADQTFSPGHRSTTAITALN